MNLYRAEEIAEHLLADMKPYCERAQIAGSIRRQKAEVKDIEIVAIPKWDERPEPGNLFGDLIRTNLLFEQWSWYSRSGIHWTKGHRPEGKYWQGLLPEGPTLDLFLPDPDSWGIILAIRTGSAEFSQALVTHARESGFPCRDGALHGRDGRVIPTPDERTVFEVLGLAWVEPELRTDGRAIRPLRMAA